MEKESYFTTAFVSGPITVSNQKETSIASIDNLKKIIPSFAAENVYDLLPIAFNIANPNLCNYNGDVIDTEIALSIYKKFIHKFIDTEHRRQDIVGHIIAASLSSYSKNYKEGQGSVILTEQDVVNTKDPFNIALAGFIYKTVDSDLIDLLLESSDPNSENYLAISSSWELAFSDWDVLLGSNLISEGQRITADLDKAKYKPYLKAYGGRGEYQGKPINRIIKGNVVPLGIGLTVNPAALVSGVIAVNKIKKNKISHNFKRDVNNKELIMATVSDNQPFEDLEKKDQDSQYFNNVIAPNGVYPDKLPFTEDPAHNLEINPELINLKEGENQDDKGIPVDLKSKLSEDVFKSPEAKAKMHDAGKPNPDDTKDKKDSKNGNSKNSDLSDHDEDEQDTTVADTQDGKGINNEGVKVIHEDNKYDGNAVFAAAIQKALANFEYFISQCQKVNVKMSNNKNLNTKVNKDKYKDMSKPDQASAAKFKEILESENSFASYTSALADAIDEATVKYGAQLDKAKADAEDAEAKAKKAKEDAESIASEMEKIKASLEEEKKARKAEKAQADFNNRMTDLASKYNMNDKDCSVVAKQIKGMDDDAYASWASDFSVIAADKAKKDEKVDASQVDVVTDKAPDGKVVKTKTEDAIADIQHDIVTENPPQVKVVRTTTEDSIAQQAKASKASQDLVEEVLGNLKGKSKLPLIIDEQDGKSKAKNAWSINELISVGR